MHVAWDSVRHLEEEIDEVTQEITSLGVRATTGNKQKDYEIELECRERTAKLDTELFKVKLLFDITQTLEYIQSYLVVR